MAIQAVADGPRATEQFTAIASAFIAGLAASLRAQDLLAEFISTAAHAFLESLSHDSLTCINISRLLAHMYCCGALQARDSLCALVIPMHTCGLHR